MVEPDVPQTKCIFLVALMLAAVMTTNGTCSAAFHLQQHVCKNHVETSMKTCQSSAENCRHHLKSKRLEKPKIMELPGKLEISIFEVLEHLLRKVSVLQLVC